MSRFPRVLWSPLAALMLAALVLPSPAEAQMDARERQQCVESCITRTAGPGTAAYRSCVARRCDGKRVATTRRSTPATPAAPEAAIGTWQFGAHAAVGTAAHVQLQEGVIGLVCQPGSVAPVSLRVTNGLFRGSHLTYMFDRGVTAATLERVPGMPWAERSGSACQVGVSDLGASQSLILIDGQISAIEATATGRNFTITHAAGQTVITSGLDAVQRLGARVVPLTGAAGVLGQLLAGCAPLQADLQNSCD
jgi:hypothetical protein